MSRYYRIRDRFVPGTIMIAQGGKGTNLVLSIRWPTKDKAFVTWLTSLGEIVNSDYPLTLDDLEYYATEHHVHTPA